MWRHIIFRDTSKFNHFFCVYVFARFQTKDHLGTRRLFSELRLFVLTALKVVHWRTLISLHDMQMVHLQIFKE